MDVHLLVFGSERFRSVGLCSERSFDRIFLLFSFSVIFGQGPMCEYFIYRSAPDFQTITTFCSLVGIRQNQCPHLRYDPLYPVIQVKHVFEILKFELDHI